MRAIFTYHSIDDSGSPISVAPAAFRRHVDWFAGGPVRVVGLDELASDGSDDRVAITFDDGFRNFASDAAPLLLERGLPVTVFVVAEHVGRTNAWGGRAAPGIPELPLLDWNALGELTRAGVAIGGHTGSHPDLTGCDAGGLDRELDRSAERIERELGAKPRWLAYPFGRVDDRVAGRARQSYAGAVTTDYRPLGRSEDRLRMPRLDAFYFQRKAAFDGWNSRGFRRALWLRRQARRARVALGLGGKVR